MSSNAQESLATINDFLASLDQQKQAEAYTEAGDQDGGTSHPVKDVDDRCEAAEEGARSSENTADVKEDQGAPSVENAPEATAKVAEGEGTAAEDHLQIGTNVQATGDDPENETGKAKGGKEDPGSDHPARTDNDSLDGYKWSSADLAKMPLNQMAKLASDLGQQLLVEIANSADAARHTQAGGQKRAECSAGGAESEDEDEESEEKMAQVHAQLASQVGYDLAGLITGRFDKQAADRLVENTLQEIIKEASEDADRVATYLHAYHSTLQQKQAMGEEMGGMPPGVPPEAAAGGAPLPAEGGEGGPEGGGEVDIEQLLALAQQLGISEEELLAALQAEGGEEGLEGPGGLEGGGEMPAEGEPSPTEPPMEVQAADAQAAGQDEKVAAIRDYISEIVSRSRAKQAAAAPKAKPKAKPAATRTR